MLNSLAQALPLVRLIVEATVGNPVDKTGVVKLDSAFVALCPVFDSSDHGFVESVPLGDVIIISAL